MDDQRPMIVECPDSCCERIVLTTFQCVSWYLFISVLLVFVRNNAQKQ